MDRLSELEAFATCGDRGLLGGCSHPGPHDLRRQQTDPVPRSAPGRAAAPPLHRTTRRVSLTEIGVAFRDRVLGVMNELCEAEAAAAQLHEQPRGLLRVSVPTDFGRLRLAETLAGFAMRHADIRLEVGFSDPFVEVVEEGFDIVIRSMLVSGLGIALLPTFLIGDDLLAGRLETLFMDRLEADTVTWRFPRDTPEFWPVVSCERESKTHVW